MSARSVVVTGMGCVCAAGNDVNSAFAALRLGLTRPAIPMGLGENILPFPMFAVDETVFAPARRHSAADTLTLARYAAHEAVTQAKLAARPAQRMGVLVGTTSGTALHFLSGYAASRTTHRGESGNECGNESESATGGTPGICEQDVQDMHPSNPALALAELYDAQGPVLTVSNACTSGADAIGLGMDLIRQGICDVVLCGGADAISIVPHTGFARLTVASPEMCRPYDADRKGLNLGEAAGMLVLESADRKSVALGYAAGYGTASDSHHFTAPHPQGRGLVAAVERALSEAGITADDMAFVNVHGTATQDNDRTESHVLQTCLPYVPVWASKGSTGHTLGAAGALEAVLTLTALRAGLVPASQGFYTEDQSLGISPTRYELPLIQRQALSLSLGFGGSNSALVMSLDPFAGSASQQGARP